VNAERLNDAPRTEHAERQRSLIVCPAARTRRARARSADG
jgi:hypothetical protein